MQPPRSPALVLIADDNPLNIEVLCGALAGEGLNLAMAGDGEEVLAVVGREERRGPLPSPAVLTEAELAALPRPQPDDLARLLDLSSRGRVLELIEEAKRLQEKDEQLRPWLGRLSALAKSFQFKAVRALLVDSRREPPS